MGIIPSRAKIRTNSESDRRTIKFHQYQLLPDDIKLDILNFLTIPELLRMRLLDNATRILADSDRIWKGKVLQLLGTGNIDISDDKRITARESSRDLRSCKSSWKQYYIETVFFVWDENKKGNGLFVINQGRTVAAELQVTNWKTILSRIEVQPSTNFCEFRIDAYNHSDYSNSWKIIVGVVGKYFNFSRGSAWIGMNTGWGYVSENGMKVKPGPTVELGIAYGESFKEGDVIGVLVSFENSSIEFFKNHKSQGVAFTLPLNNPEETPFFFAVSLARKDFAVSITPNRHPQLFVK